MRTHAHACAPKCGGPLDSAQVPPVQGHKSRPDGVIGFAEWLQGSGHACDAAGGSLAIGGALQAERRLRTESGPTV